MCQYCVCNKYLNVHIMKAKLLEADNWLFNILRISVIGILEINDRLISYLVKVHSTIHDTYIIRTYL